jgi:DNA-binding GntR family transcriptional regulator
MTEADFRDIYVARDALESSAVRTILTRGRGGETARELLRHVELMETAQADGDWGRLGRHDLDFHVALVAASQSPRLTRMFDTVISETKLCLGVLTSVPARIDLVPEHRLIADELEAGGEEQVLRTLRKHYDDAVLTLIDPQQGSGPVGIQGGARDV